MRVLVNRLVGLGRRTGIGHYTVELLRCLRAQAAPDIIDDFPRGWLRRVSEACRGAPPEAGDARPALGGAVRTYLREGTRDLLTGYFRLTCLCCRYDVYHEPNFIPLRTGLPTVATLHDLSVLLHPEWHPRDRVV